MLYVSDEFEKSAKWDFIYVTYCPVCVQANIMVESVVMTAKSYVERAEEVNDVRVAKKGSLTIANNA